MVLAIAVLCWMRYILTPPPTPPRLRGGERLRQQMRGGVPTVLQASKNRYSSGFDGSRDSKINTFRLTSLSCSNPPNPLKMGANNCLLPPF